MSKETAELFLDLSEWLLLASGAVLCFGIVGEYARGKWWKKNIKVWEMLVIFGVTCELIGDGGVFLFGKKLQRIEGAEIAQLSQRSTDALNKSLAALGQAKDAGIAAESAVDNAGEASGKADDAVSKSDGALRNVNHVAREAAQIQNELTLTEPRSWLFLSEKIGDIVPALKPFAGQKV